VLNGKNNQRAKLMYSHKIWLMPNYIVTRCTKYTYLSLCVSVFFSPAVLDPRVGHTWTSRCHRCRTFLIHCSAFRLFHVVTLSSRPFRPSHVRLIYNVAHRPNCKTEFQVVHLEILTRRFRPTVHSWRTASSVGIYRNLLPAVSTCASG